MDKLKKLLVVNNPNNNDEVEYAHFVLKGNGNGWAYEYTLRRRDDGNYILSFADHEDEDSHALNEFGFSILNESEAKTFIQSLKEHATGVKEINWADRKTNYSDEFHNKDGFVKNEGQKSFVQDKGFIRALDKLLDSGFILDIRKESRIELDIISTLNSIEKESTDLTEKEQKELNKHTKKLPKAEKNLEKNNRDFPYKIDASLGSIERLSTLGRNLSADYVELKQSLRSEITEEDSPSKGWRK